VAEQLRLEEPDTAALVVHPSPILEAIIMLFELLWERAAPIGAGVADEQGRSERLTPGDEEIVSLLAAGFTDQAVALQLGISLRTVTRLIKRIMETTGAQTRFQAGLLLGQHGSGRIAAS
jgi:DNA-binding NarL/FixJ family response regulator